MIIDRHNYEEFFLLYVDNELCAEDRCAVENFMQQNRDLAHEMIALQETVLPKENIQFEQKELLYAKSTGITIDNYEEFFVLAADNELDQQQKEEVESFILKHPVLQNEFILFQQTRLEPETIVFDKKEKLYKKEKKERRIVFLRRAGLSAAAAVVGLVALTWFFTDNKAHVAKNNFIAKTNKAVKYLPEKIEQPVKPNSQEATVATINKKESANTKAHTETEVAKPKHSISDRDNLTADKATGNNSEMTFFKGKTQDPVNAIESKTTSADPVLASTKSINKNNLPSISENPLNTTLVHNHADDPKRDPGSSIATQAVYHEIDTREDEDEDKNLYIGSVDINKNKLKGLIRKAATFFGKKSNTNDDGKTIKIAGFEIKNR